MKQLIFLLLFTSAIFAQSELPLLLMGDSDSDYELLIPDTVYLASDQINNIYFENLGLKISRSINVAVTPDSGAVSDSCWRWTPTEADTMLLTMKYPSQLPINTNLAVMTNTTTSPINVLVIGDSRSNGDAWLSQLRTLYGTDLNYIGTQGTSPVLYEAYSGKTYEWFESNTSSPFVYNTHINVEQYLTDNAFPDPDIVIIRLGTNDVFYLTDANRVSTVNSTLIYADSLINSIHSVDSAITIGVCLETPPSAQSIWIGTYPTLSRDNYVKNIHYLNTQLLARYGTGGTHQNDYVSLIPLYLSSDTENDFTNGVHESTAGSQKNAIPILGWLRDKVNYSNELITASIDRDMTPVTLLESDFSTDADIFQAYNGTVAGNIDGISDGTISKDDVLRYYANATNAGHFIYAPDFTTGKAYALTWNHYIPSTNTAVDGVFISSGTLINGANDYRNNNGEWVSGKYSYIATAVTPRYTLYDGVSSTFIGANAVDDDLFYLKDYKRSEIPKYSKLGNHTPDTSSTYSVSADYSLKIVSTGAGNTSNAINLAYTNFTTLVEGNTYRISFYIRSETATTTVTVLIGDKTDTSSVISTTGFELYTYTFTATASTINQPIKIYLNQAATVYIDDISLKSGS